MYKVEATRLESEGRWKGTYPIRECFRCTCIGYQQMKPEQIAQHMVCKHVGGVLLGLVRRRQDLDRVGMLRHVQRREALEGPRLKDATLPPGPDEWTVQGRGVERRTSESSSYKTAAEFGTLAAGE